MTIVVLRSQMFQPWFIMYKRLHET